jgi:hypothetical protein
MSRCYKCNEYCVSGVVCCDKHVSKNFSKDFSIINDRVYRNSDQSLVLILWHNPVDDKLIYDPKLIESCLSGNKIIIHDKIKNTPNSLEFIPKGTYYKIFHEYSGYCVELLRLDDWKQA